MNKEVILLTRDDHILSKIYHHIHTLPRNTKLRAILKDLESVTLSDVNTAAAFHYDEDGRLFDEGVCANDVISSMDMLVADKIEQQADDLFGGSFNNYHKLSAQYLDYIDEMQNVYEEFVNQRYHHSESVLHSLICEMVHKSKLENAPKIIHLRNKYLSDKKYSPNIQRLKPFIYRVY